MADRQMTTQVEQWIELVDDLLRRGAFPGWHRLVLPLMSETFSSPASWHWIHPDGRVGFEMIGMPSDWPSSESLEIWTHEMTGHPLLRWYAVTGDPAALTLSRVPTAVVPQHEKDRTTDLLAVSGVERQLSVPMTVNGFVHEAFVLGRAGQDFAAREVALARQLQPLLRLVHRQASALGSVAATSMEPTELTSRELAVLALLSEGLTARAIGHRLMVSERTVHKHLAHVYRKLDARDRLSAVLTAHQLGLLTPEVPATAPSIDGLRVVNLRLDEDLVSAAQDADTG